MAPDPDQSSPERSETDESLRLERQRADLAISAGKAAAEQDADVVVARAREHADEILDSARDTADEVIEQGGPRAQARAALDVAREREDEAVREERAAADESVRRERAENKQLLARLLPLERDKTDRRLLTERARADEDLANRDDFMNMVSHDLRSLLGGIVMSASLLAERGPEAGGDETAAEAARIQRYAARMNRLIGDLTDVASIDAGKLSMRPTPGDLAGVMAEAVATFQAAAEAKGVSLRVDPAGGRLPARFDGDRMLQVLINLVSNAIKFTPAGGRVTLRGERRGDQLRVAVVDSGAGIPDHLREAVFERFWQVTSNDRRGLGLGLYISRCIVEAHGGSIAIETTSGDGSTFVVTVPATA
jgi:signal transduction histidine kinase